MTETIFIAVLVVAAIGLVIYAVLPNKREEEAHVKRRMLGKKVSAEEELLLTKTGGRQSAAKQMLERVAPYAMKPVMPKSDAEMSTLREKLSQAGFRREYATRYFLASKTIIGAAFLVLGLSFAWMYGASGRAVFGVATCAGGLGFMLPNLWLGIAKGRRAERIRNGLPDSLDLLVVAVESGLGIDAGLQRVSEEMRHVHVELAEEMQIATMETQMGVPRTESLLHMSNRCGVEEMRSLVAMITQAEKFGTSIAKALRTQADTLRTKRRLKAEERAQKTAVKLMLPLIFFIFPSIFVVLLGPAVMKIVEAFGNNPAL
jgi:tight adherence protein C